MPRYCLRLHEKLAHLGVWLCHTPFFCFCAKKNVLTVLLFSIFSAYLVAPFLSLSNGQLTLNSSCFNHPIREGDHQELFSNAEAALKSWNVSARLWGYNPNFHSGYLGGVYLGVDNHPSQAMVAWLGEWIEPALLFNCTVTLCYLLYLLTLLLAVHVWVSTVGKRILSLPLH